MPLSKIPAVGVDATGTPSSSTFFRGDNTWATPADSGLGVGQTWQTVTRVSGTTYTNSTGKPIACCAQGNGGAGLTLTITVNGVTQPQMSGSGSITAFTIIPAGQTYVITTNGSSLTPVVELR
tara:strand:- start:958 stop:1326 length:369 start_codon:yes stop_codon:yes gene_type:complete